MELYGKIAQARLDFHKLEMKKSGHNSYSNYDYFELGDFIPHILDICDQHKIFTYVSFGIKVAVLTAINLEKPEEIMRVTSPMSSAKLTACHEVQNLGAVQTYIRRYLYTTLFEIIEKDALDSTTGKDSKKPKEPQKPQERVTEEPFDSTPIDADQLKGLCALMTEKSVDKAKFKEWMVDKYGISSRKDIPKGLLPEIKAFIRSKK